MDLNFAKARGPTAACTRFDIDCSLLCRPDGFRFVSTFWRQTATPASPTPSRSLPELSQLNTQKNPTKKLRKPLQFHTPEFYVQNPNQKAFEVSACCMWGTPPPAAPVEHPLSFLCWHGFAFLRVKVVGWHAGNRKSDATARTYCMSSA